MWLVERWSVVMVPEFDVPGERGEVKLGIGLGRNLWVVYDVSAEVKGFAPGHDVV